MAGFKKMAARFGGKCAGCGGAIAVGEQILWAKGQGARHAACGVAVAGFSDTAHARGYGDAFDDGFDEYDAEAEQIRREEAEYMQGYHEVRAIQAMSAPGSALREQMYLEMEMAAYNRGEDY